MASVSHLLLLLTLLGRLTISTSNSSPAVVSANDTYICEEDEVVTLQCRDSERIEVLKVLYGRQRMDKCNDFKRRLPADCYSQSATTIVMNLCHEKKECSFSAVRLYDKGQSFLNEIAQSGRWRCNHIRGRELARIEWRCVASQSWHIRKSPRENPIIANNNREIKLSCTCFFTEVHPRTSAVEVSWFDFTAGDMIYSSGSTIQKKKRSHIRVHTDWRDSRIYTVMTIVNFYPELNGTDKVKTYECRFTRPTSPNVFLYKRFLVKIMLATTTESPSTPTPTIKGIEPPKSIWSQERCNAVRRMGYRLCAPRAKCLDKGDSFICRCAEGFTGSGMIPGSCAKIPKAVRLHGPAGRFLCPTISPGLEKGCVYIAMKEMKKNLHRMDLRNQLESVTNFTSLTRDLSVDELLELGGVMNTVVDDMRKVPPNRLYAQKNSKKVAQMVVRSTSNLLARRELWKNIPSAHARRSLATNFTNLVTQTALATTENSSETMTVSDGFIDLKVVSVTSAASQLTFRPSKTSRDTVDLELHRTTSRTYADASKLEHSRVVFMRLKAIGEDLESAPRKSANASGPELKVLSEVISATASRPGLVKKISFRLAHGNVKEITNSTAATRKCAYWNEANLTWAFDGCRVANSSDPILTSCECDHLTSFAVLLDFRNVTAGFGAVHQLTLSIITYVGCCLSIFCCIFGVWTYDILRRSKGDRMNSEGRTSFFIYEMICLSLLVAQTIFLMGIFHTSILIVCRLVAALLHYFFLLLFEWMLVAGVYYILVYTQPYSIATVDSHRGWLVFVILLAPAIIVGVSLGLRMDGYGTRTHCWLSVSDGLIWAFVGPVTGMLSVNMILLSVLIVLTWRIKPSEMLETGEVNKTWVTTRALKLRYELLFCIVLGATWIFGYFLIENTTSLVFSYIFAILNSLQGVFILISYANWSRIRAAYIAEFRRKRWLPESFRRWLHSRQYSPGGPPVGMAGSSGTPSQRRTGSRATSSQRGLLVGSAGPHGSDSAQLSRTTRSTRLGSGSSGPGKWSVSAGAAHGLDANDNSVAMVTETEAAFNENYLGHSMMDEPRQTYVDFDERFVSQSDAEIINMTAALPLREHEEDGEHQHRYSSSSSSSSSASVDSVPSTPPSSFSGPCGAASPHDDLSPEPPKLPVVCAVPSPFIGGTPAKEASNTHLHHPSPHPQHPQPPQPSHAHFQPVLGSATVPRPLGYREEEEENDYLVPNANNGGPIPPQRHTLDCRSGRHREDADLRVSVSAKQKRFSQSDAYANADDVVYYSQPPLEPSLPPDHPRQGPSRVTNV